MLNLLLPGRWETTLAECPISRNDIRSEEHTSELQSQSNLVCRLLLEKKKDAHVDSLGRRPRFARRGPPPQRPPPRRAPGLPPQAAHHAPVHSHPAPGPPRRPRRASDP